MTDEERMILKKQIEEQDKQLAIEAVQAQERRKKEKIRQLFDDNSLINKDLQNASFENYNPASENLQAGLEIATRYVEIFNVDKPKNLLFTGNYGTGKSHLSVAMTKELMNRGYTCLFISMPKLLTKIKTTYNKKSEQTESDVMKYVEDVDLLVLDDIGAERDNEWAISKLFEILDGRLGKHTIFTSNYNQDDLKSRIGDRNYSRIMHNTHEVKMIGEDYRLRRG